MNGGREDVVTRIVKLMAMADPERGASENEMQIAMGHVKRLMDEHNISVAEVTIDTGRDVTESIDVGEYAGAEKGRFFQWEYALMRTAVTLTNCRYFIRRVPSHLSRSGRWVNRTRLVIVGDKLDANVARELYRIFREAGLGLFARSAYRGAGAKSDYLEAFSWRLYERACDEVKKDETKAEAVKRGEAGPETVALVRVTDAKSAAIDRVWSGLGLGKARASSYRQTRNHSARQAGASAANGVSLRARGLLS